MEVFCELGRGDADIAGAVAELAAMGDRGWIVLEQDRQVDATSSMDEVIASVRRNFEVIGGLVEARAAERGWSNGP